MKTVTRIFICLLLTGLFTAATGCDTVPMIAGGIGNPVPGGQGGSGQDQGADPATPTQPQEQAAVQLQQRLSGQRLTYLTSSGNGQVTTSYREEHDLCSSGQFQLRTVSQTSGFGAANEDIFESSGTWRIATEGAQLKLELNTQQSSTGYSGIDQYPIELGPQGELFLNGFRFFVTPDNPICN